MVTKRKIAEAVLNRLNGGIIDRDSKITIRQAMFAVGEARNALIQRDLFENYANFQEFDVPFDILSEYTLPTLYNEKRGFWYVNLPVNVISLYNGMGIYHVSVLGDMADDLIPLRSGATSLFAGLPASTIEGQRGYIPTGGTLEIVGIDESVTLLLRLIVNSHDIGQREDFRLPADKEIEVTQMAFQMLQSQIQFPQDNITDNVQFGGMNDGK
jgi:hypothetical protein